MRVIIGIIIALLLLSISGALYYNFQNKQKSQAQISFSDSSINISFLINPKDQIAMQQFSSNLGVGSDWTKGINFKLDQDSVKFLSKIMPSKLSLSFSPKEIDFSNQGLYFLNSSLPSQSYSLATGSAHLNLERESGENFNLTISDPKPLVEYASSSGKLYLSNQLQSLFPIMDKVATIELKVNGGNLQGSIKLK